MNLIKTPMQQFLVWLLVLTPICIFLGQWKLLLILILMLFFVSVIAFVFIKEFRKYLPFTFALFVALSAGIWGFPHLKSLGLLDFL